MLDPVPFFVGGGALHSPEVFRSLAYAATGGAEGIVKPGDLRVVPLAVPGGSVTVSIGGAYAVSRAANALEQSYVLRNASPTNVAVTPTGSSGGKSVLIVGRIEDPWVAGEPWADPADVTVGPYVFFRVVDCPAGTVSLQDVAGHANDTGVTLARIDMPANTAAITAGMITDLRKMARWRSETVRYSAENVTARSVTLSDAWQAFPSSGIPGVRIPDWATHMAATVRTTYSGVSGSPYFQARAFLTTDAADQVTDTYFATQTLDGTSVPATGQYRSPIELPTQGYFPIPARHRGVTRALPVLVRGINTGVGAVIRANPSDYFYIDVTWTERAS